MILIIDRVYTRDAGRQGREGRDPLGALLLHTTSITINFAAHAARRDKNPATFDRGLTLAEGELQVRAAVAKKPPDVGQGKAELRLCGRGNNRHASPQK
jgi:hypothetical protein